MQIHFSFFKMKIQGILIVPAVMRPYIEAAMNRKAEHGTAKPGMNRKTGMQDIKPGKGMNCPNMKRKGV